MKVAHSEEFRFIIVVDEVQALISSVLLDISLTVLTTCFNYCRGLQQSKYF